LKKFLLGIVVVLLLVGGAAVFVVETGRVPVAATRPPDVVDRVAMTAKFKAVLRGGAGLQVKLPADSASIARGREHYVENCLPCHGAPGVKAAEFAEERKELAAAAPREDHHEGEGQPAPEERAGGEPHQHHP
jgi:mono/diheme cytochrome c family protein